MDYPDKILEKNNVKPTAMRLLILRYLINNNVMVSLTDIEKHFYKSERTTLYRTLKTFVDNNIAHKVEDGSGITKYAICPENCHCSIDSDLHVHFHCNVCGETTCLPDNKIPSLNLPKTFILEEINLVVKGTCDKCNER
ncbi:transcriptional repressor [uncultured Sunxiuqinia sp.]|jgi:Fur family transcriptional regulator, ferric uptake regulator|uniref:Fur family transcriptional regulator n=1 Tax=uncultured Sunxiuqinia sp. TaxID=1573825 RepID=UPI0030DB72CF|tara:strand:+ start:30930 stop:31346 length:417 start_codon:yes stop_codon:yes gene_type:complete